MKTVPTGQKQNNLQEYWQEFGNMPKQMTTSKSGNFPTFTLGKNTDKCILLMTMRCNIKIPLNNNMVKLVANMTQT